MGVLPDFPLRLWARQQEHIQALLREFSLLLIGERSGEMRNAAPGRLLELAESFTATYGPQLTAVTEERQRALDQGLDRIDSHVPLVEGLPDLLNEVDSALSSADEFCRGDELLILPRPLELVRLADWTRQELTAQYGGADPTPWRGPF